MAGRTGSWGRSAIQQRVELIVVWLVEFFDNLEMRRLIDFWDLNL